MTETAALEDALAPLLQRVGAEIVPLGQHRADDIVLAWRGAPALAVRLPRRAEPVAVEEAGVQQPAAAGLDQLIEAVARELGGSLKGLSRPLKQRAVRILEERGAFTYRRSAEIIADALGVSRFTVYNYLNRERPG